MDPNPESIAFVRSLFDTGTNLGDSAQRFEDAVRALLTQALADKAPEVPVLPTTPDPAA